ncbi:MAG TPA: hypothetical protein VJ874_02600 [Candidatus Thermoplasmatota archaeon]|nr:hypothetical protein [Candidatus Thermoplasmatota archaeon]
MRAIAVPTIVLLALAGLALVPDAAAAPSEPPCNGTIGTTKTIGPVTFFASPPCYTVSVDPGCVYDDWHQQSVQRVTVRVNVCEGPTPPPTTAGAAAVPPVCIWKEAEAGPVKAGFDQCRQSHETTNCSNGSPQQIHRYEQAGPVYAQVHFCFPHSPPPDLGAAASESGPCGGADLQQRCPAPVPLCSGVKDPVEGAVDVDVSPNCHVLVTADFIDCLWGETWVYHSAGPVTVGYTTCRSPDTMSTDPLADPFPTCVTEPCGPAPAPAMDACKLQSATPTSVGPTGLNAQRLVWGSDATECDVDVEPIGACAPPSGTTKEYRVAFVHVTLLLCGGGIGDGWS